MYKAVIVFSFQPAVDQVISTVSFLGLWCLSSAPLCNVMHHPNPFWKPQNLWIIILLLCMKLLCSHAKETRADYKKFWKQIKCAPCRKAQVKQRWTNWIWAYSRDVRNLTGWKIGGETAIWFYIVLYLYVAMEFLMKDKVPGNSQERGRGLFR